MKVGNRHSRKESKIFRTVSGGITGSLDGKRMKSYPLWPEFSDADINIEKWEVAKSKDRGKSPATSPATQVSFESPEGRVEMPSNMQVSSWQRPPQELAISKSFVVVENEDDFDLINYNRHLLPYPLIRLIVTQITMLWNLDTAKQAKLTKNRTANSPELSEEGRWKPWEHIYSLCKGGKGHIPQYNPFGKYIIRLFFMGCWRKIVIDDTLPYSSEGSLLLPTSSNKNELWPMLLSKAIIKVASVNCKHNSNNFELSQFSVIHTLTGWIPEIIPMCPINDTWEFLKKILPEWTYPNEAKEEEVVEPEEKPIATPLPKTDSKAQTTPGKKSSNLHHENKKDRKTSEPLKERQKSDTDYNGVRPNNPEYVVFVTFSQLCPNPAPLSVLKDMADGSEVLRNIGLSQMMYHPVLLKNTRSIPLVPKPVEAPLPRWKLIRPRVKPTKESEDKKPDMWLEISSPFLAAPKSKSDRNNSDLDGLNEFDEQEDHPDLTDEDGLVIDEMGSTEAVTMNIEISSVRPSGNVLENKETRDNKIVTGESLSESRRFSTSEISEKKRISSQLTNDRSDNRDGKKYSASSDNSKDRRSKDHDNSPEFYNNEYKPSEEVFFIKSTWIDFENFCKSFKNIMIFHKPSTYRYIATTNEYKPSVLSGLVSTMSPSLVPSTPATGSGKKFSIPLNSNTNLNTKHGNIITLQESNIEQNISSFLVVDSVKPSEIIISFSSLINWPGNDVKQPLTTKESVGLSSSVDVTSNKTQPGSFTLVVEPYSWMDIKTFPPLMSISSNGVYGSCLLLPPGRNILRINVPWSLGFSLTLLSTTPFIFGDEDVVLAPLKEESERFKAVANDISSNLDLLIGSIGDTTKWKEAYFSLTNSYNQNIEDSETYDIHKSVFYSSLFSLMSNLLIDQTPANIRYAFILLTLDFHFLRSQDSKKEDEKVVSDPSNVDQDQISPVSSYEVIHDRAALKLQKNFRGSLIRKVIDERDKVSLKEDQVLHLFQTALRANPLQHGTYLLRKIIENNPMLLKKYDFCEDITKKLFFNEYSDSVSEIAPHQWTVLFRGIFYTEEDRVCIPKLYGNTNKYNLHVVDNDTGEEVRRVFYKPVSHKYTKNQKGYTFVAEIKNSESPIPSGKWTMRLIGYNSPLPSPINNIMTSNFQIKEFRDYYSPNIKNIICRYIVQCKVSQVTSIQVETSHKDVIIQIEIINQNEVVAKKQEKGHLFLPYCYFVGKTTPKLETDVSTPTSVAGKTKSGKAKQSLRVSSPKDDFFKKKDKKIFLEEDEDLEKRLYYIEVKVIGNSWPLNEVQQQFVAKLKEAEKEEFKLISTKASNDDLFSLDKERARRLSKDDKTKRHKDSKAKKRQR